MSQGLLSAQGYKSPSSLMARELANRHASALTLARLKVILPIGGPAKGVLFAHGVAGLHGRAYEILAIFPTNKQTNNVIYSVDSRRSEAHSSKMVALMSDGGQGKNLIFISYTRADRDRVAPYYSDLKHNSYNVWMDFHEIRGGQNWDFEIQQAMDSAVIIIAFISNNSVDKRGYVQKELCIAIEKWKEKLVDDIFLVPVMLDEMEIPLQIRSLQVIRETDANYLSNLRDSIVTQLTRLGEVVGKVQESHGLRWDFHLYKDAWEGLPGYEATYELIRIYSSAHPQTEEIGHLIRGNLSRDIMAERQVMFEQRSDHINFGKSKYWRTNTYNAKCTTVPIVENVISIEYTIYTFLAGAAHGYTNFMTFSFIIHPTVYLGKLEKIFTDAAAAFPEVQKATRSSLLNIEMRRNGNETIRLEEDSVNSGTENWGQFYSFFFTEDGLVIDFAPYGVAPYSHGPQRATVKWRTIRPFVKHHILCALGREFEHFNEKSEAEQEEMRRSLGSTG